MYKKKVILLVSLLSLVVLTIFSLTACDNLFNKGLDDSPEVGISVINFDSLQHIDILFLKEYTGEFEITGIEQGQVSLKTEQGDVVASNTKIVDGKLIVDSIYTDDLAEKLIVEVQNESGNIVAQITVKLAAESLEKEVFILSQSHYYWGFFLQEENELNYVFGMEGPDAAICWDYYDNNYFLDKDVSYRVNFIEQVISDDDYIIVTDRQIYTNWGDYIDKETFPSTFHELLTLEDENSNFLKEEDVLLYQDINIEKWFDNQRVEKNLITDKSISKLETMPYLDAEKYKLTVSVENGVDFVRVYAGAEPFRDGEDVETLFGGKHLTLEVIDEIAERAFDIVVELDYLTLQAIVQDEDVIVFGDVQTINLTD